MKKLFVALFVLLLLPAFALAEGELVVLRSTTIASPMLTGDPNAPTVVDGMIGVVLFAEIQNTGEAPVRVTGYGVTLLDLEGNEMPYDDISYIDVMPSVLAAGETAYVICLMNAKGGDYKAVGRAEAEFVCESTQQTVSYLDVDGASFTPGGGGKSGILKATLTSRHPRPTGVPFIIMVLEDPEGKIITIESWHLTQIVAFEGAPIEVRLACTYQGNTAPDATENLSVRAFMLPN